MSQTQQSAEISTREMRQIFKRHRGAAARIAEETGVSKTTISQVLRGRVTSRRLLDALTVRAIELLKTESEAN